MVLHHAFLCTSSGVPVPQPSGERQGMLWTVLVRCTHSHVHTNLFRMYCPKMLSLHLLTAGKRLPMDAHMGRKGSQKYPQWDQTRSLEGFTDLKGLTVEKTREALKLLKYFNITCWNKFRFALWDHKRQYLSWWTDIAGNRIWLNVWQESIADMLAQCW